MQGRCKTCRWWGHGKEELSGRSPPDYEDQPAECKECGSPALIDIDDAPGGYLAVKGDGFGLDYPVCGLITGPEFGCVRWEPLQPPPAPLESK